MIIQLIKVKSIILANLTRKGKCNSNRKGQTLGDCNYQYGHTNNDEFNYKLEIDWGAVEFLHIFTSFIPLLDL